MNINDVIKYPILTEKTYKQMSEGVYTFAVDKRSNKVQVRKTVEFIFGVKVVKVNIFNVPKKEAKLGRSHGFTNAFKRAIVYLSEGDIINIFPDDAPATEPKKETKAKVDKPKMSDAEKRAAEKIAQKAKATNVKKEVKATDTKTPAKTSTPKKSTKATSAKSTSKASTPKKSTKATSSKTAPKKVAPKKAATKKTVKESKGD